MPVVEAIPWMEILLVVIFVGLIAIGFWQGLLRELWFLISLYLGAILATLYGDYVGAFIARGLRPEASMAAGFGTVASVWGFFIVLVLTTAIFFLLLYALVGRLRLRASALILDKIGGILLGLLAAFLITSFVAFLLSAIVSAPPVEGEWPLLTALRHQRDWPLLSLFRGMRPIVTAIIMPWLSEGGPVFLRSAP